MVSLLDVTVEKLAITEIMKWYSIPPCAEASLTERFPFVS